MRSGPCRCGGGAAAAGVDDLWMMDVEVSCIGPCCTAFFMMLYVTTCKPCVLDTVPICCACNDLILTCTSCMPLMHTHNGRLRRFHRAQALRGETLPSVIRVLRSRSAHISSTGKGEEIKVLDFHGRVTCASSKNFQLEVPRSPDLHLPGSFLVASLDAAVATDTVMTLLASVCLSMIVHHSRHITARTCQNDHPPHQLSTPLTFMTGSRACTAAAVRCQFLRLPAVVACSARAGQGCGRGCACSTPTPPHGIPLPALRAAQAMQWCSSAAGQAATASSQTTMTAR